MLITPTPHVIIQHCPSSDSAGSYSPTHLQGNKLTGNGTPEKPRINLWDKIQSISKVTGKAYDVVFKSLLQCNMDKELVIKLHQMEKPQIQSGKLNSNNTGLSEGEIKPPSDSSNDCTNTVKTMPQNEDVHSANPRPKLEKQASSISLDVQSYVSTLDLHYSLGTVFNDSLHNENRTSADNMKQNSCNSSNNTTPGETPLQDSWVSQ